MLDEIRSRAASFLEPIAGAEPAGAAASLDPRYEAVRAEVAKLDAPTGGEIDWKAVARGCKELLVGTSKDFLLASQNAYALLQLERWAGLATGLAVLDGMLERWWEQGFPPVARLRGRGNAVDWLTARLEIALPTVGVQAGEIAAFEAVRTLWTAMGTRARDRLGEFAPAMGGVAEALERLRINLPAEAVAAAGSSAAPTPSPAPEPAPAAAEAPPAEPTPAPAPAPAAAEAPAAPPADDPVAIAQAAAEPWLAPIDGPNPAGVEARYDTGYEAARVEIAKLEAITDQVVEWKLVQDNAGTILRTRSKDLLMASYFAFARFKLNGLADLLMGLQLIIALLERYWEGLQPERVRGRANALAWLVGQLELVLPTLQLTPKQRPLVLGLQRTCSSLATQMRERMGSDGPSLGGVNERVQRMLLALPEEKPPEPPKPAPAPTPTPTTAPTAAPAPAPAPTVPAMKSVAAVDNPDQVNTFLQETSRAMISAAGVLRTAAPANPTAYRLLRQGLYLHLSNPPPSDAGGKTQIPALPAPRRAAFVAMENNGKWEAMLEEAESALMQSRFCLDLHRYSHRALERLGDSFAGARTVVASELAALLSRMPTLPDLLAGDGTPLSDGDTKTWLAQVVLAGSGGGGGSAGSAGDEDKPVFAEVRGLLTAGKAGDGMRIATARIEASTTVKQRFTRRLALASALLDTSSPVLARGMFASLEQQLRSDGLMAWEPELASQVLEGFVRAIRAAAKAGSRYEQADAVYERLCQVDPMAAARLAG